MAYEARYDYAGPYRSMERAEAVLDNMFASGDVCEGERPQIEKRGGKTASWSRGEYRYYITIPM